MMNHYLMAGPIGANRHFLSAAPPVGTPENYFRPASNFARLKTSHSRLNSAPSKILPSKSATKLLNFLAASESKKEVTAYKTTTPAPPSPVLWLPGGDADCGGSDRGAHLVILFCYHWQLVKWPLPCYWDEVHIESKFQHKKTCRSPLTFVHICKNRFGNILISVNNAQRCILKILWGIFFNYFYTFLNQYKS